MSGLESYEDKSYTSSGKNEDLVARGDILAHL